MTQGRLGHALTGRGENIPVGIQHLQLGQPGATGAEAGPVKQTIELAHRGRGFAAGYRGHESGFRAGQQNESLRFRFQLPAQFADPRPDLFAERGALLREARVAVDIAARLHKKQAKQAHHRHAGEEAGAHGHLIQQHRYS